LQITAEVLLRRRLGHVRHLRLLRPSFARQRPGFQRRLVGDAVQPVADLFARYDGRRLADENQEGRLERILGVVVVAEDPTAHAQDHRAQPSHQSLKGRFLASGDEAFQELSVRQTAIFPRKQSAAQVLDHSAHRAVRHAAPFAGRRWPLLVITRRRAISSIRSQNSRCVLSANS
jgi:hypothetical protein